jgi:hypothetical protein
MHLRKKIWVFTQLLVFLGKYSYYNQMIRNFQFLVSLRIMLKKYDSKHCYVLVSSCVYHYIIAQVNNQ